MIKVNYEDNKNGTIIKTVVDANGIEKKYAYDIAFWRKIPKNESIVDYSYSQLEPNLKTELSKNGIATNVFCSGTCAAMILAITYADKKITPINVLYWGNDDDENNRELNWGTEGLRAWEQNNPEKKERQVYDNRFDGPGAVDGSSITTEEEYLKNIKIYLSAKLPVVIEFPGQPHFVVVVGVESNVKLEEATFEQLVIYEPYWEKNEDNEKNRITTIGESPWKDFEHSYRLITPYPIIDNPNPGNDTEPDEDENGQEKQSLVTPNNTKLFVADENGNKTHDPYYIDPVKKSDGEIIPAKQGRPLKEAIDAVNYYYSDKPKDKEEKDKIIEGLKKLFTGEDADAIYEDLVVTENGEYEPNEGVTAFKKVTVDVKANVKSKDITANGVYKAANDNAEGFDVVNVNVPDNSDDMERYKLLWLKANGGGETVETDIPKPGDPEDPGNSGEGGNYVFENAVDVGSWEELGKYTPMFKRVETMHIVETCGGLALHLERIYNGNRIDVKLTVTNLKNGMSTYGDSCFRTPLDIRHNGCEFLGVQIHNGMVSSYFRSDFSFPVDTWLSEIDFHAPANWNRHYILV